MFDNKLMIYPIIKKQWLLVIISVIIVGDQDKNAWHVGKIDALLKRFVVEYVSYIYWKKKSSEDSLRVDKGVDEKTQDLISNVELVFSLEEWDT